PDLELGQRPQRLIGEPFTGLLDRLLAGEDLHPGELTFTVVGLAHRRVEDALRSAPDVGAGAITLDVGDDRAAGDDEVGPFDTTRLSLLRHARSTMRFSPLSTPLARRSG